MKQMQRFPMPLIHSVLSTWMAIVLAGCSGGLVGSGTGSGGSNEMNPGFDTGDGLTGSESDEAFPEFRFVPDDGIRVACASQPEIGQFEDRWYLYHRSEGSGERSMAVSTSKDALQFDAPRALPMREQAGVVELDIVGYPAIIALAPEGESALMSAPACAPVSSRWFYSDDSLARAGQGIASSCSMDGRWFRAESGLRVQSEDGGLVGRMTAFVADGVLHLYTEDGRSPNDFGEYRQRIWHYVDSTGTGEALQLMSDDPLKNDATYAGVPRYQAPVSALLGGGQVLLLTGMTTGGDQTTLNLPHGEITGWRFDPETGDAGEFVPLAQNNGVLITVQDFISAGLSVTALHSASLAILPDGGYRLLVEASMPASALASSGDAVSCGDNESVPVILSATSRAELPAE